MADADFTDLVSRVNRLVLARLGGRSLGTDEQLANGTPRTRRRLLTALAESDGLAPRDLRLDERAATREHLTELVAHCANLRAPDDLTAQERAGLLSPAGDRDNRRAFGVAMSRTWAQFATPEIAQQLLSPRVAAELGEFDPPRFEHDQETAWAIATKLGEQVGQSGEQVLGTVLSAGYGRAGAAAAELVLSTTPGYQALNATERESAVLAVADELEDGLSEPVGDVAPSQAGLGLDVAGSRTDRGLAALGWANYIAADEIATLVELRDDDAAPATELPEFARFAPGHDASTPPPGSQPHTTQGAAGRANTGTTGHKPTGLDR